MGTTVEFKSNGSVASGYLAQPDSGPGPGVIVLEEAWGLVPHIMSVADRLAEAGFTALAPDLYHGRTSTEPGEAMKMMMGLNMARAAKDMSGAVDYVADQAVRSDSIGVVGFCMGGGLALVLACQRPDVVKAVAPFYGLIPWPTAQPDYMRLQGAVHGHYAERDNFASPAAVAALEKDLLSKGKRAEFVIHPGVDHAFFNDDRPEVYDADAATSAWSQTTAFLHAELDGAN
jgi:carboxymethylenebutenolidase